MGQSLKLKDKQLQKTEQTTSGSDEKQSKKSI
jgi:hypothetical protein